MCQGPDLRRLLRQTTPNELIPFTVPTRIRNAWPAIANKCVAVVAPMSNSSRLCDTRKYLRYFLQYFSKSCRFTLLPLVPLLYSY